MYKNCNKIVIIDKLLQKKCYKIASKEFFLQFINNLPIDKNIIDEYNVVINNNYCYFIKGDNMFAKYIDVLDDKNEKSKNYVLSSKENNYTHINESMIHKFCSEIDRIIKI